MVSLRSKAAGIFRALFSKYMLALVLTVTIGISATVGTGITPVDHTIQSGVEYVSNTGTQPDDINETAVVYAAHERVNEARTQRGLSPLNWDPALYHIADEHSDTIAETGEYGHVIDGQDHSDRYEAAEYSCDQYSGENIAYTFADAGIKTGESIISYDGNESAIGEGLVRSWMNSPPHRENILRPEFQREAIGIGVAQNDGRVQVYATQNFC